jgi:hypothetical protein
MPWWREPLILSLSLAGRANFRRDDLSKGLFERLLVFIATELSGGL